MIKDGVDVMVDNHRGVEQFLAEVVAAEDRTDLERAIRSEMSRLDARELATNIRRNRAAAQILEDAPTIYRGLDDLDARAPAAEPPVIAGGWLGARDIALMSARRKRGKTTLVRNLIAALVDGTPWLGDPSFAIRPEGYRVMLWDGEERERRWYYWMDKLNIRRRHLIDCQFFDGRTVDLTADMLVRYAIDTLTECGTEIWVIDNYSKFSAAATDNNADVQVNAFYDAVETIRRSVPSLMGIVLVAHAGKKDIGARGSSAFEDRPAQLWTVTRPKDAAGPTLYLEGREADEFEVKTIYDPETRRYTVKQKITSPIQVDSEASELMRRLLEAGGTVGRSKLLGTGRGRKERASELGGLMATGKVVETKDGNVRRYRLADNAGEPS
jgi:hypothetical protein